MSRAMHRGSSRAQGGLDNEGLGNALVKAAATGRHISVFAVPGSAKTTASVNLFIDRCAQFGGTDNPSRPVMLAPTRTRAEAINAMPGILAIPWQRPAKTPMSFAFQIISSWHRDRAKPLPAPMLFTGADEDALLLELLHSKPIAWPFTLDESIVDIESFRSELRELFAQCETYGCQAEELVRLSRSADQPMWAAAAQLLDEYRSGHERGCAQQSEGSYSLFNTVNLQRRAAEIVRQWNDRAQEEGVFAPQPVPELLIVDDAHDCSMAALGLIEACAQAGSQVVLMSCPDVCVNSYRGASPFIADKFAQLVGADNVETIHISRSQSMAPCIVDRYNDVLSFIPEASHGQMRPLTCSRTAGEGKLRAACVASEGQQALYVANYIRRLVLATRGQEHPVAWSDVMVLCPTQRQVHQMREGLARQDIPLAPLPRPLILGRHRATMPMLRAFEFGQSLHALEAMEQSDEQARSDAAFALGQQAHEMLMSRLVGLDARHIQQLKKLWLRIGDSADATMDAFESFLADLLVHYRSLDSLEKEHPWVGKRAFEAIRRLRAIGDAADPSSPHIGTVLWNIYTAGDCQARWSEAISQGGYGADMAHDDLDAVIALLRTADVYTQRHEGATVGTFATYLLNQQVPADNLARSSLEAQGVVVATTTESAGRRARAVVITGMQHDQWPRTSAGSTLFSVAGLVDEFHRHDGDVEDRDKMMRFNRLVDQHRSLAVALSRSDDYVLVCAIDNEEETPSVFFQMCAKDLEIDDYSLASGRAVRPMSLKGLVGDLRRILVDETLTSDRRDEAAKVLAFLVEHGVEAAHPTRWVGTSAVQHAAVGLSTGEALFDRQEAISMSPSLIESLQNCPLRWLLSRYGGQGKASDAQALGTLVHAVAEEAEKAGCYDAQGVLEIAKNRGLAPKRHANWLESAEYERQVGIIKRVASYLSLVRQEDAKKKLKTASNHRAVERVEAEQELSMELGDKTKLFGISDRLEYDDEGVRIVDFKTTKNPPTRAEAEENIQLRCYQLMAEEHLQSQPPLPNGKNLQVKGGRLVYPAKELKNVPVKLWEQPAMSPTEKSETVQTVKDAAATLRGSQFNACKTSLCQVCEFQWSCPLVKGRM